MRTIDYLNRVYRTDEERRAFIIDVKLEKYIYAFNEWDSAYFKRRDLDKDLAAFLATCSEEIPLKYAIRPVFAVTEDRNPAMEGLLSESLETYFSNKLLSEQRERRRIFVRMLYYVVFGIVILLTASWAEPFVPANPFGRVLTEGLFIGAWVLFWEAMTIVTFARPTVRRRIRELKRFLVSEVGFEYDRNVDRFDVDSDRDIEVEVDADIQRAAREKKELIGDTETKTPRPKHRDRAPRPSNG